jgi:hypothetical protein
MDARCNVSQVRRGDVHTSVLRVRNSPGSEGRRGYAVRRRAVIDVGIQLSRGGTKSHGSVLSADWSVLVGYDRAEVGVIASRRDE